MIVILLFGLAVYSWALFTIGRLYEVESQKEIEADKRHMARLQEKMDRIFSVDRTE